MWRHQPTGVALDLLQPRRVRCQGRRRGRGATGGSGRRRREQRRIQIVTPASACGSGSSASGVSGSGVSGGCGGRGGRGGLGRWGEGEEDGRAHQGRTPSRRRPTSRALTILLTPTLLRLRDRGGRGQHAPPRPTAAHPLLLLLLLLLLLRLVLRLVLVLVLVLLVVVRLGRGRRGRRRRSASRIARGAAAVGAVSMRGVHHPPQGPPREGEALLHRLG